MANSHREIDVACPQCDYKNRKTIGWLRDHTKLPCGGCGAEIALDHKQFHSGLDEADKAMDHWG
jgi:hypothetical protein